MRVLNVWALCLLTMVAGAGSARQQRATAGAVVVFEGSTLITGESVAPIERFAFVVEHGTITQVGTQGTLRIPPGAVRVNLNGKTVMPALVDDHVHLGYRKELGFSADNYTRENLRDTLTRFAYFGVGAVLEAGTARGDLPFQVRSEPPVGALYRTAGRGLAMPNAGPGVPMRDAAYGVTTEAEARRDVQELAARRVDMIKIWVDDRDHTVDKLKPTLYRAIIDEAHRHGLRVMAHIVELEDAKDLLRAGVDGFGHAVRDRDVDDEFIGMLKARPNVFFTVTLWGERRAIYSTKPAWVDEPLLRDMLSVEEVRQLADSFVEPTTDAARRASARAQLLMRNIARLNAAGVKLGLGTDTGGVTGGQYFGLSAHIEMELMVKAGMTPAQVIVSATRNAAEILQLRQMGTVAVGKSADFIVLDANPLDNIVNTRRIAKVYLRGTEVDRAALRTSWSGRPSP